MKATAQGTCRMMIRPCANQPASNAPIPTPTAKNTLIAVSTSTPPPIRCFTTTGTKTSVTEPLSQNQLLPTLPTQSRASRRMSRISEKVDPSRLRLIRRSGAAAAVEGMNQVQARHAKATPMSCTTTLSFEVPCSPVMPPAASPSRIATKEAPSTNALPDREFAAPQVVGQDAVFDRGVERCDHAEEEQRDVEQHDGGEPEARRGDHLDAEFRNLQPPRDPGLVVAVGELAAEARQQDRRQDEDRQRQRDQGPALSWPTLNRIIMASMLRTRLSLKAEKNWLQNRGAKRRASINDRIMRTVLDVMPGRRADFGCRPASRRRARSPAHSAALACAPLTIDKARCAAAASEPSPETWTIGKAKPMPLAWNSLLIIIRARRRRRELHVAGLGHHLGLQLHRVVAELGDALQLQRLQDLGSQLRVLRQGLADALHDFANAIEVGLVGHVDADLVHHPVAALVLDGAEDAERHGVERSALMPQLDGPQAEGLDRALVGAALDILADPEGVVDEVEDARDDVLHERLGAEADRHPTTPALAISGPISTPIAARSIMAVTTARTASDRFLRMGSSVCRRAEWPLAVGRVAPPGSWRACGRSGPR